MSQDREAAGTSGTQRAVQESRAEEVWRIAHLRLIEDAARAERQERERRVLGKDPRSDLQKRIAQDENLNMIRRKQEIKEEWSRLKGKVPALSPARSKGLRFFVDNSGDMSCRISDKGPKKPRRQKRSKGKGQDSMSSVKKKQRTSKWFNDASTPMSSSEDK